MLRGDRRGQRNLPTRCMDWSDLSKISLLFKRVEKMNMFHVMGLNELCTV